MKVCRYRYCEDPYPPWQNQSCAGTAVEVRLCRSKCTLSRQTIIIIIAGEMEIHTVVIVYQDESVRERV